VTGALFPADFSPGQIIFTAGEPGDRLYVIDSGKVKISQRAPDGRGNLQTVLGPPEIFGEPAVFDPGPRTSTVTALTEVRTMTIDRSGLHAWLVDQPEIGERLLRCWLGDCGAPSINTPSWCLLTCPAGWPSDCCSWRCSSAAGSTARLLCHTD
jgi:Cyclic nucleotide-binding domain